MKSNGTFWNLLVSLFPKPIDNAPKCSIDPTSPIL